MVHIKLAEAHTNTHTHLARVTGTARIWWTMNSQKHTHIHIPNMGTVCIWCTLNSQKHTHTHTHTYIPNTGTACIWCTIDSQKYTHTHTHTQKKTKKTTNKQA